MFVSNTPGCKLLVEIRFCHTESHMHAECANIHPHPFLLETKNRETDSWFNSVLSFNLLDLSGLSSVLLRNETSCNYISNLSC